MKNLTILYFTLFLSFGNIVLSSLHDIEHQHHCDKHQVEVKCNECVLFKNLDNLQFEISIPGLIIILSNFIFVKVKSNQKFLKYTLLLIVTFPMLLILLSTNSINGLFVF